MVDIDYGWDLEIDSDSDDSDSDDSGSNRTTNTQNGPSKCESGNEDFVHGLDKLTEEDLD